MSPLSLVARLWVWLSMHQDLWICLNILESAWTNCSDYANALKMHDHITCSTDFWRCLMFQITQASEIGTVVYAMVTQKSEYVWVCMSNNSWICLNNPSICLNVTVYCRMSLNMSENIWITVLTVPGFSVYFDIVIITLSLS